MAKRDDGFHEIKSVFYPVDLCDSLEIRPSDEVESRFELTGLDIGEVSQYLLALPKTSRNQSL